MTTRNEYYETLVRINELAEEIYGVRARPVEKRKIQIKWTCGVVEGHYHDTEGAATACMEEHMFGRDLRLYHPPSRLSQPCEHCLGITSHYPNCGALST
jgi:hypothetical protein